MKSLSDIDIEQRSKMSIVGQAEPAEMFPCDFEVLFLLAYVFESLRKSLVDVSDKADGNSHLLHELVREKIVVELVGASTQKAIAAPEVMIEEAQGHALTGACYPQRELCKFHCKRVHIKTVDASLGNSRADEFDRRVERECKRVLLVRFLLFGRL